MRSSKAKLDTELAIRRSAMDSLARREHSRAEVFKKLKSRVEDTGMLNAVLDQLEQDNLLSDERFCESFVRYRRNNGYGPIRVGMELRERGVVDNLIGDYLDESSEQWLAALKQLVERKYGPQLETDMKSRAKQQRFLAQRGYSFEQINRVLKRFSTRNETTV